MFQACALPEVLDVSGFRTANVTNMSYMFSGCSAVKALDVSGFDTSNVTNMQSMFASDSRLTELDLSSFNTSNVTNMDYMFSSCTGLTSLNLSSFDTAAVTETKSMFHKCTALETVTVSDAWTTENVSESYNIFLNCTAIKGGSGTEYDAEHINAEYARIDTDGTPGYFTGKAGAQSPVMGDVNADGLFNITDVVCTVKWLYSEPDAKLKKWTNGDFTHDNKLDARDLTLMKRALIEMPPPEAGTAIMAVTSAYDSGKVFTANYTIRAGDVFFESENGIWRQNVKESQAAPHSKLVEIQSITDTSVTYLNYTRGDTALEWTNAYGEQSDTINSTESFIVYDGNNYSYHITFSTNT